VRLASIQEKIISEAARVTQENQERTSAVVLEVVTAMLWHRDDTELRIADVCRATGMSSSVIYNHFGSRQGLIDAAYLSLYGQASDQMLDELRHATAEIDETAAFYHYLRGELDDPLRADYWLGLRQMRLRVATAAVARESLRADFAAAQDRHLGDLATFLGELQERALVGRHLSPEQLARVFEAYVLSHTYNDIALHPSDAATWIDTFWALLNPQLAPLP
jgi:AcrR family transcriptional regulator